MTFLLVLCQLVFLTQAMLFLDIHAMVKMSKTYKQNFTSNAMIHFLIKKHNECKPIQFNKKLYLIKVKLYFTFIKSKAKKSLTQMMRKIIYNHENAVLQSTVPFLMMGIYMIP